MGQQQIQAVLHWSGGKDSALALYTVLQQSTIEVRYLLTTVSEQQRRITMHGVPEALLHRQVACLGIPLQIARMPTEASMAAYEQCMREALAPLRDQGVTHSLYGDIFLEDLRRYREDQSRQLGLQPLFPIWQRDTYSLVQEFIELGFRAIVVAVSDEQLGPEFIGRELDQQFLEDLPEGVDPCGENGEFHTFVYDGPLFRQPVKVVPGIQHLSFYPAPSGSGKVGFWFQDLQLAD